MKCSKAGSKVVAFSYGYAFLNRLLFIPFLSVEGKEFLWRITYLNYHPEIFKLLRILYIRFLGKCSFQMILLYYLLLLFLWFFNFHINLFSKIRWQPYPQKIVKIIGRNELYISRLFKLNVSWANHICSLDKCHWSQTVLVPFLSAFHRSNEHSYHMER